MPRKIKLNPFNDQMIKELDPHLSNYYSLLRKYLPGISDEEAFDILFVDCSFYTCVSELQLEQKIINYKAVYEIRL